MKLPHPHAISVATRSSNRARGGPPLERIEGVRGSGMKIVRRFLVAPALARLIRKERGSARVAEGYFPTQSGRNSHVSLEGGQCHLVLVTADPNGGPVEERTEVPRAHADALFDVCAGRAIYDRARLSITGGREAFVDRFTVPGALDLVSVEFEG